MKLPPAFVAARLRPPSLLAEPLYLLDDDSIAQARTWPGMPSHLVPFAGDGGGNYWCFDTRLCVDGEYPIDFWDHELPDESAADGPPTRVGETFAEWLEGWIERDRRESRRRSTAQRREALAERLSPYLPAHPAYAPDADEIAQVEPRLRFPLPAGYRWFTSRFGAVSFPVSIADALDLPAQQDDAPYVWFGRDRGRRFGFDANGAVVEEREGATRVAARSFHAWLQDEIGRREAAAREPGPAAPRVIRRRRDG